MNWDDNNIPSAWVWSHYKGELSEVQSEIPLAWVWSQYTPMAAAPSISRNVHKIKSMNKKIIFFVAASLLFALAAFYKETNEVYAPHDLSDANISDSHIAKALQYLREAYKISPRDETEKLINQVEKLSKN